MKNHWSGKVVEEESLTVCARYEISNGEIIAVTTAAGTLRRPLVITEENWINMYHYWAEGGEIWENFRASWFANEEHYKQFEKRHVVKDNS